MAAYYRDGPPRAPGNSNSTYISRAMYFNVSQLMRESSGSERRYSLDETYPSDKGAEEVPVRGRVRFLRTNQGVWVSADLDTETRSVCCRCLSPVHQPVRVSFEEEYLPSPTDGIPTPEDLVYGDSFYIDQGHGLDISEAVSQYTQLSAPMKPLCRGNCAGICPDCGVNRNEASCSCRPEGADPRWGPLLELVESGSTEKNGVL